MADIESTISNESIKCPDADPRAALRADLERRQLAAGDEAAERGVANAQGLRSLADSQGQVGVHCVDSRRQLWTAQDIFFTTCGAKTLFDKCPKVSLSKFYENQQTTGRRPEIGACQPK